MDLRLRKTKKNKQVNQQTNKFKKEIIEKREKNKMETTDDEGLRTSVTQGDQKNLKDSGNVFENKSINQLILFFSIPAILSLMLESFASMIDTVFAGHLGEMSGSALSAMGILSPVLSLFIAAQLIFGVSTGIIIAKRLGEKDKEKINNTFKVGLFSSLIFSTLISLIIFICQDQLLSIIGANGQVRVLAKQFLNVAAIFNVFSSVGYTLVNMIRSFGYPKMEIVIVISATLINIIFNVLFTFVFKMGIVGIGLATLISEMSYTLFAVLFLVRKGLWMQKSYLKIKEVKSILLLLIKIGFVQFLMQALNSLNGFTVNKVLLNYGDVVYLGSWAVCNSIYSMMLLPLIGFTEGIQSVIAYYQGSHNDGKKKIIKAKTLKYSLAYSLITTTVVYLFSGHLTKLFTLDANIITASTSITKIMLIGFPFMGIIYTLIAFMQVSGQEESASKLEIVRQVVLFIPLCIILPLLFSEFSIMNIKPELGVFFAMPISNIISLFFYTGRRVR
ncbi:MAG: MATE family efflux transporter [Terrisporobacter sp.]|uniref:MATE family efflux transporter n=1 Tax=Terrisporobacter sp. TaxID=1965305 RepID=UPI002FC722AA